LITATDALGNVSTVTITFQVLPTCAGLINAVYDGVARGLVSSTMQSTLLAALQSAQAAINNHNNPSARNNLNSFIAQVQAQSGKKIDAGYAALLINWAQNLISRLP
jgi:hypothetical protein